MKIRVAGIEKESVVDGPGLRFVLFVQGCSHRCSGCHNPGTWDFDGGQEMDTEEILKQIEGTRLIRGVTFSGGEPFEQAAACALLAERIKGMGLDIVTYTGYTFEELSARGKDDQDILKPSESNRFAGGRALYRRGAGLGRSLPGLAQPAPGPGAGVAGSRKGG